MKTMTPALAALFISCVCDSALASNTSNCYWMPSKDPSQQVINIPVPGSISLARTAIGGVLAHVEIPLTAFYGPHMADGTGCLRTENRIIDSFSIEATESGSIATPSSIKGIGYRVSLTFQSGLKRALPYTVNTTNTPVTSSEEAHSPNPVNMSIDLIRTGRDVQTGVVNFNLVMKQLTNNSWDSLRLRVGGITQLNGQKYFSGCSGKNLNISMGKLSVASLKNFRPREFNLDILCTGVEPGSRLPVKVYFEGDSKGPGRLNLVAGGAKGVELSLVSGYQKLPFTKAAALNMNWDHSQPNGELYRLPIQAKYETTQYQPGLGKADATMSYILEYN